MATDNTSEAKRSLPQPAKTTKKRKHMDPRVLELRTTVQKMCGTNDLMAAWTAYQTAIAAGTRVEPQVCYCLLSLCDGLGDRGIHIGTPSATAAEPTKPAVEKLPSSLVPDTKRQEYAEVVVSHMEQLQLPLNETAYTSLVRLHSRAGSVDRAAALLTQAESTQQCRVKLRLYAPILVAYATSGDVLNAVRIWKRLVDQGLLATEKEFRVLLEHSTNVYLTERLLAELAEEILVPSRDTTHIIQNIFESKLPRGCLPSDHGDTMKDLLDSIHPIPVNVFPLMKHESSRWNISPVCQIDTTTGRLKSGCLDDQCLKPVAVTEASWKEMIDMNDQISRTGKCIDGSAYQGGGKGPKIPVKPEQLQRREREWKTFYEFLDAFGSVDVVIDGANVGYYEQNFSGAPKHVNYEQIDVVVSMFQEKKKSVIVFLHTRHFSRPLMPAFATRYLDKWQGILYRTPPGMNDDWFWLQAALMKSAQVVTNDEMRDHHFQMVAPRAFLRWRERHQIHFSHANQRRDIVLHFPKAYSRRIQAVGTGLVIPLPKRGDLNRFLDGTFVAGDEEPEDETYLCVSPKPTEPKADSSSS